jgi:tetratricopeptide (TPR) repeat protein
VLLRRGDVAGAIDAFRQATRLDPSLTEARVNLAQALVRAGRREEARAEAAEAERLKAEEAGRGRAMILAETGAGLLARGEAAAAVRDLREAVEASPSFVEAQYLLGIALRRSGALPREAQEPLLRVLDLDPGHAEARLEVARILGSWARPTAPCCSSAGRWTAGRASWTPTGSWRASPRSRATGPRRRPSSRRPWPGLPTTPRCGRSSLRRNGPAAVPDQSKTTVLLP